MKYISLNWTLASKFSIGKKKRMRDCRILMAHDCTRFSPFDKHKEQLFCIKINNWVTLSSYIIESKIISMGKVFDALM